MPKIAKRTRRDIKVLRRKKKNPWVQKRILEGGQRLFFRNGFSKVTMDELASELGMSKKTIYEYFPSKEELLRAIIKGRIKNISQTIDWIIQDRKLAFVEKLKMLLTFLGEQIASLGQPFIRELEKNAPGLWREFDEFRKKKILANFGKLLAEGSRRGVFRKGLDQEFLLQMYANTVQSTLTPELLSRFSFSAQEAFEMLIKVFFEGILTEKARLELTRSRKGLISKKGDEYEEEKKK